MLILFRKLHKWIGLAIGIQVAIWMVSGFMMGLLDHNEVQGRHNQNEPRAPISLSTTPALVEPGIVLAKLPTGSTLRRINLQTLLGLPVYRADLAEGPQLFDATTGRRFKITDDAARAIADDDYAGNGKIVAVTAVSAPAMEVRRHTGDAWRIDFNDDDATSLYVAAGDGRILERRNDTWRLFDLFWMLHIMDYQGRESFNNTFAIVASLIAAWFAITGFVLFFASFRKEDFLGLIPGGWGRKRAEISVCAPHGEIVARISSFTGGRLYDELARGGVVLPSNCGGGGTCGLCVVSLAPDAVETAADITVIPEQARREGVRLSCQAEVSNDMSVGVSDIALSAESHTAEVVGSRFVTPFIREISLRVLDDDLKYHAGSYTHVLIPPHKLSQADMNLTDDVSATLRGRSSSVISHTDTEIRRAYSLANAPEDDISELILNVRFMPPPVNGEELLAGAGSSYMWSLREGDVLDLVGPLGDFQATSTDRDMIFIGGGAGMAPLRSIIRHELVYQKSGRNIQYWYGARSERDLFYVEDLDELQDQHSNFHWHAVLSEPDPKDAWNGPSGFVHVAVKDGLLNQMQNHGDFEYYVCGPPPMLAATRSMLAEFGVPESQVFFDDFGI